MPVAGRTNRKSLYPYRIEAFLFGIPDLCALERSGREINGLLHIRLENAQFGRRGFKTKLTPSLLDLPVN
jgi:hypothetical protein